MAAQGPDDAAAAVERALRGQFADAPARGADLVRQVRAAADGGRVLLVLPGDVLATATARGRRAGGPSADGPARWVQEQLARTYGGRSSSWAPALAAGRVDVLALDEPGVTDAPPAAPPSTDGTGAGELTFAGAPVHRLTLAAGERAHHPLSPRPAWAGAVGFVLVAAACWAVLWSYDYRPLVCAALALGLGAAFAGVGGYPPLQPRRGVGSWARHRQLALVGATATAGLSFLVGLLAIDGLTAHDALVVLVPLVAAGAWMGGADALAVMAWWTRGHQLVADVGATRVVRTDPAGSDGRPGADPEPALPA